MDPWVWREKDTVRERERESANLRARVREREKERKKEGKKEPRCLSSVQFGETWWKLVSPTVTEWRLSINEAVEWRPLVRSGPRMSTPRPT